MICMKMKMIPANEKRNNGLRDKVYQRSRILLDGGLFIIFVVLGEGVWDLR